MAAGHPSLTYQFNFDTSYKNEKTILQSYLGVIQNVDDDAQNLTQTYSVTKVDYRGERLNRSNRDECEVGCCSGNKTR